MNPPVQAGLPLRDIHLPGPPDFWPPAPGWWLLAILLLVLMAGAGFMLWRRLELHRQRQRILAMLDRLETGSGDEATPELLAQLSDLIRRLALTRFPRHEIASLTGHDWLRFLDESGGDGLFSSGPGEVLAQGPYMRKLPNAVDSRALTGLVRHWIRRNTEN